MSKHYVGNNESEPRQLKGILVTLTGVMEALPLVPLSFNRDFPSVHQQCHISYYDFSHSTLTWHDIYLKKDNVWGFIYFFLLSQDRDSQKTEWIDRCIEELRSDTWVLPALKQIKEICSLFYEVWLSSLYNL